MAAEAKFKVTINRNWCKECDICVALCPKGLLKKDKDGKTVVINSEECTGCKICELHCPDFAIHVSDAEKADEGKDESMK